MTRCNLNSVSLAYSLHPPCFGVPHHGGIRACRRRVRRCPPAICPIYTWAPPRYDPRGQLQRVFRRRVEQSATHHCCSRYPKRSDLPSFGPNLIYPHPSVSSLAQATFQIIPNEAITQEAGQEAMLEERADHLKQSTEGIDSSQSQMIAHSDTATQSQVVVLTGSTGTLGTNILNALAKDPSIGIAHPLSKPQIHSRVPPLA
ncbi:hypothetical protein N7465_003121 [Penicillium sp. CMV-2018d]|nr:hypothetical protein N7465_003121 [Penicillium sp. CMV-2018d]